MNTQNKTDDGVLAEIGNESTRSNETGALKIELRDWFAGQVMAEQTQFAVSSIEQFNAAKRCYALADAMLAARKGKQ